MDGTLRPILRALRARGLPDAKVDAAVRTAEISGRALREVLVEDQVVTQFELASATADAYGVEAVQLSGYPVDPAAMARVPLALARRHRMLPVSISESTVSVAVTDPGDVVALDDIRSSTGLTVRPLVVTADDFNQLMSRHARQSNDLSEAAALMVAGEAPASTTGMIEVNEDAPVVRWVDALLERAINDRASDIHLEPTEAEMRVRLRIDGVLHEVDAVPLGIQAALVSRLKILSGLDITERRVPQNGRITKQLGTRNVDLRSATLPTVWGEKVVLRVLDTGGIALDLRKLGFTSTNYDRYSAGFRKPHGMILVTGPTGSGKSTTLYATLTEIARPEVNVITVEDPVEYRIAGVNQVQVNPKAGLTFAAVLPAILRNDPDVVLVGEIRDTTTAQLAIEAALTGHLVLSTLHTNDAPSALPRLIEMGIEPFLVGSALDCVLAQRLARRLCEWCKQPYEPTEDELAVVGWPMATLGRPDTLWRGIGCPSCAGTGFRGRLAVIEVMPVTEEIGRLAVGHAPAAELTKTAVAEGMTRLRDDGLRKVADGMTTVQEIVRITV